MTRLLSLALLAATLSAQTNNCVSLEHNSFDIHDLCLFKDGDGRTAVFERKVDGNGALEAFYMQPAHRSIFRSKKFWIGVGIAAGSGVLTGYLVSHSPSRPLGPAASVQQPGVVDPVITVGGPTFIGVGGPGIPVVVVSGGRN